MGAGRGAPAMAVREPSEHRRPKPSRSPPLASLAPKAPTAKSFSWPASRALVGVSPAARCPAAFCRRRRCRSSRHSFWQVKPSCSQSVAAVMCPPAHSHAPLESCGTKSKQPRSCHAGRRLVLLAVLAVLAAAARSCLARARARVCTCVCFCVCAGVRAGVRARAWGAAPCSACAPPRKSSWRLRAT